MKRYLFESKPLSVLVIWDRGKAQGILINPGDDSVMDEAVPSEVERFFAELRDYLAGKATGFSLPVNWDRLSPFAKKVSRELARTLCGEVISYAELARRIGNPKAARAVGRVMARNPFPLVVPCHRVIGSNGSLTGFGGGLKLKARLLALERKIAASS
ncbi:MAG: methylated-DNA--[protein]-cysteine S-methyltransferase [candidate division WOR-3 bacterium]|nr:methylated-DNA--[protein]-cysteine S-methyltransferase [candidate division WOR-3 bacterium]